MATSRQRSQQLQPNVVPKEGKMDARKEKQEKPPIWWSNAIFFISVHVFGLIALYLRPPHRTDPRNLLLCFVSWQLATFGITVGYHRLWSHRSFTATRGLRWVLAAMGCLGFQGSIKWWVLRHRIHHRWTDTDDDPYNAAKGLLFSHMGWIFRKPSYKKMSLIERRDLEADPVVRFQHRHYIPLTLFLGFGLPTIISTLWYNDPFGGYLYGGIIARLLIWHFTFFINSLAHWCGEQKYSRDISARGNFFLALFTGGEANHNYHHAFPRDYRNGPLVIDWDPSKWIIYLLHNYTPFVPKVYFAEEDEVQAAREHVLKYGHDHHHGASFFEVMAKEQREDEEYDSGYGSSRRSSVLTSQSPISTSPTPSLPKWDRSEVVSHVRKLASDKGSTPIVLIIEGHAVDVTAFAKNGDHPGGVALLRKFAVPVKEGEEQEVKDATEAFDGGYNSHQWPARRKMRQLRIAKLV